MEQRERKSKVTEKVKEAFSSRIKEFAGVIHSYGIGKLYDELNKRAYINATYPIETFRTDFKRMKSGGNGLLNEPALLGGILEILHFPADALFGGPTSNIEDNRKMIEKTVSNTLQNFEKQKKNQKKRIYSPRIIARANQVYYIIENIIRLYSNDRFFYEPIMPLFVWYSSYDKAWDIENETMIWAILEKILQGAKGYTYHNYQYHKFNQTQFPQDIIQCDTYWNFCLIIAYQISCIESLYSIFKKSKTIKPTGQKGPFTTVFSTKLTQDITSGSENLDGFAFELNNFCELFNNLFKVDTPLINFDKRLAAIIQNFQKILLFLFKPTLINTTQKNSIGNSPIYSFIKPENIFEIHSELKVTNNEKNILKKCINILSDENFPLDDQTNEITPSETQSDNLSQKSQEETQKYQEGLGSPKSPPAMLPYNEITPNGGYITRDRDLNDDLIDADLLMEQEELEKNQERLNGQPSLPPIDNQKDGLIHHKNQFGNKLQELSEVVQKHEEQFNNPPNKNQPPILSPELQEAVKKQLKPLINPEPSPPIP